MTRELAVSAGSKELGKFSRLCCLDGNLYIPQVPIKHLIEPLFACLGHSPSSLPMGHEAVEQTLVVLSGSPTGELHKR